MSHVLADDSGNLTADKASTSDDSGMRKIYQSQNQSDSAENFADFFVAYATVAGSCDQYAHNL